MERGLKSPTAETIARLARRYHTSADYLLGLEEAPPAGPEIEEIRRIWLELDDAQRDLVLDMIRMLAKANTPHIIGGEEEGPGKT